MKAQCPKCAAEGGDKSADNLHIYDDKSAFCFKCGYYEASGTNKETVIAPTQQQMQPLILDTGSYPALTKRRISAQTTKQWGVFNTMIGGKPALVFNYGNAQKVKFPDKTQFWIGNAKSPEIFGRGLWSTSANQLVITEGEEDALAISQVLKDWANVTSLPKGAGSAKSFLSEHFNDINKHESIVLCFDNDDAGDSALEEAKKILPPFKLKIARLPLKDACDMLSSGKGEQLKWAILKAKSEKPAALVRYEDVKQKVLIKPKMGTPWPWKTFTAATYGLRLHELHVLIGPESVGKTELIKDLIFFKVNQKEKIGWFNFEQKVDSSFHRLIGSALKRKIYLPGEWWDEEMIDKEGQKLNEYIIAYDNQGALSFDDIVKSIYYLVNVENVKFIILDNLTAMCSSCKVEGKSVHENEYLNHVMTTLFSLSRELPVTFFIVSHLKDPSTSSHIHFGTSEQARASHDSLSRSEVDKILNKPGQHWESGRMARLENIYGSGYIKKLADFVYALARNRTSENDLERRTLVVKFLKMRYDSSYDGLCMKLVYNRELGQYVEDFNG